MSSIRGLFTGLTTVALSVAVAAQDVTFQLGNLGLITGKTVRTKPYPNAPYSDGRDYYTFRNIPYAHPVINDQRFKQSTLRNDTLLAAEGLSYDARTDGPLCIQGTFSPEAISELTSTRTVDLMGSVACEALPLLCGVDDDFLFALLQLMELILEIEQGILSGDKTVGQVLEEWLDMSLSMSEDCLQLSVSTPSKPNGLVDKALPVMFFIHGGAFYAGTHMKMAADRFGSWEDVIVVGINYRLGSFGFLCLDTNEAAGNMGMLDMVVALEWVHQYIGYFGGDPERITIFGESAGSASINHLLLSSASNGLYARGIGQSGSALASWAFDHDPEFHGLNIARKLGCEQSSHDEIVLCLREKPAFNISLAFNEYRIEGREDGGLGFGGSMPCAQKRGARKFYDEAKGESPESLIFEGNFDHVPIMFGANSYEGSYVYGAVYNGFLMPNNLQEDEHFLTHELVPQLLKTVGVSNGYAIEEMIRAEYFEDWQLGNLTLMQPGIIDLLGVFFLKASSYKTVQENSKYKDSYWYSFDYKSKKKSVFHALFLENKAGVSHPGVCHADELMYLFDVKLPLVLCNLDEMMPDINTCITEILAGQDSCLPGSEFSLKWHHCLTAELTDEELAVSATMVQMWTNFAVRGDPGFGLTPWTVNSPSYVSIDKEISLKSDYSKEYHIALDDSLGQSSASPTVSSQSPVSSSISTSSYSSSTSTPAITTSASALPSISLLFICIMLICIGSA